MKAIVVDDEMMIRKGILKLFEMADIHLSALEEASNGREALQKIRESKPDLILTDIRMPVMDGLELIERIREMDDAAEIIVLTGFAEFAYVQKAIRYQVADYLLKPVTQEHFNEAVLKVLQKDPARWTGKMDVENIGLMKESVAKLAKCVMLGDEDGADQVLENWFGHCSGAGFSITEMKQVMGHFLLLFRSELGLKMNEYPSSGWSGVNRPSFSTNMLLERWKQYVRQQIQLVQARKTPRNQKLVDDILRYIERHYGDPELNLQTISRHCGLNPAYLSKIFRETMHRPITQYISEFRLEKARQKLAADAFCRLIDVAEQCGFQDYPYFSKLFKKRFGVSPMEYKDMHH